MKVYTVKGENFCGIIHEAESKANCPHCTRLFTMDELEPSLQKSSNGFFRKKCKGCKRFVGIATDITGDFHAYEL